MVQAVFVDASAWIALFYPNNRNHERAALLWKEMINNDWPLCTTNWTLYEAATFLSCRVGRYDWAVELLTIAQTAGEVLSADEVEHEAINTFRNHGDKRLSIVDCANFQALRKNGCEQAFTFDRNFEQAQGEFGFKIFR